MPLVSAPSLNSRFTQLAVSAVLLISLALTLIPTDTVRHLRVPGLNRGNTHHHAQRPIAVVRPNTRPPKPDHPIDRLVARADADFERLLAEDTPTLHAAAEAYRKRRGRQPPPGFDVWYNFAAKSNAVIVEQFWDQIYHDLNPFWGVPAKQLREESNKFEHRISVRNGNATGYTDVAERPWINIWKDMIQSVAHMLPDVDVPINVMDESRVVVPWEEINAAMLEQRKTRRIVPEPDLKTTFGSLQQLDNNPPKEGEVQDPPFEVMGPYWPLAVVGCPPDSPARKAYIDTDFKNPPPLTGQWPEGSSQGYVQNWTLAKSPCDNANLQGLHGTFVEPISISTTKRLFPLFGGSKLSMNNEILLPPAMYWTDDPFYSGGPSHGKTWEQKHDSVIWRGAASGGRNREENWTRFHRHRFVAMINATAVKLAETGGEEPRNFVLPTNNTYDLVAHLQTLTESHAHGTGTALSDWIDTWSDAAFVHLLCFPATDSPADRDCPYSSHYFSVAPTMEMRDQYLYKYLPDIDGNSFSGRYRAFLYSTSLPIKATIYNEWHDSRLIPWRHFVPMDNTFADFYGIMEYFLGNPGREDSGIDGVGGHDAVAKRIAMEGKRWAERTLRKEDMQVYVLRLLLEFARVCDEERERLGWREGGVGRRGDG